MKALRRRFSGKLAVVLVASLPLLAQDGTDILKLRSHPPLQRIVVPDANPAAGPTGIFPNKLKAGYGINTVSGKGGGMIIAIVDAFDNPNAEADFGVFNTTFGLPACTTANGCFKKIYQTGTVPPADTSGWSNEIAIDIQWAHAVAPAAKIYLVESNSNNNSDLYAAVDVAVRNGASVVSMSWIGGEASSETSSDSHFQAQHVVFLSASGDNGHGAGYPAASPYVVAVGGTSLTLNSSTGAWVSETAWSGSGGGQSSYETEPAYQMGVQTSGKRGIPDVAFVGNPSTGVPAYNTYTCGGACYTGWDQWGGTSIGTPMWAGIFAIVDGMRHAASKAKLTQPQVNLYPLAEADYHDITSGTNGSCGTLCKATAGYDYVTGIGSPQANLLIPALVALP